MTISGAHWVAIIISTLLGQCWCFPEFDALPINERPGFVPSPGDLKSMFGTVVSRRRQVVYGLG